MKLVPSFPLCLYQTSRLQHFEVLRDRLTSQVQILLHCQTSAQFEQGLAIPLAQLVQN
jgi:hypothetical protein